MGDRAESAPLDRIQAKGIHCAADIVTRGVSHFRYRAVEDNIFDKVFRGVYQDEIEQFDPGDIKKEYIEAFKELERRYRVLQGKYNYQMGYFAEYLILDRFRVHAVDSNDLLKSITRNLPGDFNFCRYSRVWKYDSSPGYSGRVSVDIFAVAESPGDYSIIGEVKNRQAKKFSKEEAMEFERKFARVKELENIERAVGFVFSRCGFTKDAESFCKAKGIAYSEDEAWLGAGPPVG